MSSLHQPTLSTPSRAPRRLALLGLVTTLGWLTACGGGGDGDSAAPSPASLAPASTCNLTNFQADLLAQINAARAAGRSCGATPFAATTALAWNDKLFSAAEGHSRDMATNNYFSHTSQDGRTASRRVTDAGYVWRATGENIAVGQRDVTTVMNGWLASEGHCSNIMNRTFQDVAVACVQQTGSTNGRYWTMVLARP